MSGWLVTGATTLGDFHAREKRPNQDAIGWMPREGGGTRIIAAVSDGHGAAPHFRSDRGARFAIEGVLEVLSGQMDSDDPAQENLPDAVVAAWRGAVMADMQADPLDRDGGRPGAALAPYGATLVAAAATADELTLVQIGDGDMLLIYPDGKVVRPLAADAGLVGEQTYSLCMDDAAARVRTASLWREGLNWPMAIVLATDGVSKSFRDEEAFLDAARQLASQGASDWASLERDLPAWLAAVSHDGSGDDASLCLALNLGTSVVRGTNG
jgi:hypothetical protein